MTEKKVIICSNCKRLFFHGRDVGGLRRIGICGCDYKNWKFADGSYAYYYPGSGEKE